MEKILIFLVLFPFGVAALQSVSKSNLLRRVITYISTAVIISAALAFSVWWYIQGSPVIAMLSGTHITDIVIIAAELFLMLLITVLAVKYKKYYAIILSWVQTIGLIWFEFKGSKSIQGYNPAEQTHIYIDNITVIMLLIISIIGSLITVYACGYMVDYHRHHTEVADRRRFFFSMMYVFIGAMFGLVLSSNLTWIYFFWEITSVVSFLLIGYTKTEEAVNNSFKALWMNLLGGCGFCAAIIWIGFSKGLCDIQHMISFGREFGSSAIIAPVIMLAFAALTKSAQLPFSKWLLGAMVAPTPSSALLHSATMVKAGVYLLIRLAPLMYNNTAGIMVSLVGGFTFLVTSLLAMTVTDGKRLLAYSTISNLGLITACTGLGTSETVWAAVFLVIFHAVSKSLLFQTVGSIENITGTRDIEKMESLLVRFPLLAYPLVIGISGMFLAPFGMLVSKWAALRAFIETQNKLVGIILVLFICYGSSTTLYYWAKWLAKVLAHNSMAKEIKKRLSASQESSIFFHCFIMLVLCLCFPLVSSKAVMPYLTTVFPVVSEVISSGNLIVMIMMLCAFFLVPLMMRFAVKKHRPEKKLLYFNGYNAGDDVRFISSFGEQKESHLSNWYLEDMFGENKIYTPCAVLAIAVVVVTMLYTVGGAF